VANPRPVDSKPETLRVSPDTFVTLLYVLFDQDGNVAGQADKDDPLTYVHGYAQIVPGLERGVTGLARGERRELVVDPDEAFGEPDEKAVVEIDRADLPDLGRELVVGDELIAEDDEDDQIAMRVIEVRRDSILVDTNHPLAGQTVRFEVEVCDVRSASEEEIAEAEAELEARANVMCRADGEHGHDHDHAHHDHAHDHDHLHDHDNGAPVIQLRRKLPN
jgi:FKBP-type peptidyl-prolyl cis-trans isomerase SlyD